MVPEIKALIEKTLPFIVAVAAAPKYWSSKRKIRRLVKERNEISIEVGAGDRRELASGSQ